jgi:hypothetical protein
MMPASIASLGLLAFFPHLNLSFKFKFKLTVTISVCSGSGVGSPDCRLISRGSSRKNVGNFNTMNIKFGIVGNDNLGGVGVGLQFLKR